MSAVPLTTVPNLRRSRGAELSAMCALFALTVRQHLHGRRLLVLCLMYLLPCVLAAVLRSIPKPAPADLLEFALILNLLPHGLAPLTALLYAGGIIRDEIEEQTLTYLLLRSVPRWGIYATKMLATMLVTGLLVALATVALYVAIYANTPEFTSEVLRDRLPKIVGIFALAQVAYCALFGFLGLIARRSLLFGIIYITAIEGVLANLDFVARSVTIVYYVRTLVVRWMELPERILHQTNREWGLSEATMPTADQCLRRLVGFAVIATLFAAWWFARREYRVKTPGA
jgi:ABC-2 type transport system permease protein